MKAEMGFVGLLTTERVIDDLRFATDNGFDWYELDLDWPQNFNLDQWTVEKIRKICVQSGLKIVIHTSYYLPTASPIPEIKEAVVANLTKAVDLAVAVGSDRITVHPGVQDMPQIAAKVCIESLVENMQRVVDIGQRRGVRVCLENFPREDSALCASLDEYQRILSSVDGIAATLDVGHTNTTDQSPKSYLTALQGYILDMHIHDNSGEADEHICPGEGTLDFPALLSECKVIGYNGPFMLELFPRKNILKGRDAFLRLWEEA